jgi:C4-dicarboxylate transporter DctQ subunit
MIVKILNNIEEYIVWPLMGVISILVFLQVVCRYLLKVPTPWVEELLRITFIWIIMLSASIGIKRKAHLGVTKIMQMLPRPGQAAFYYLGVLVIIGTCVLFVFASTDLLMMQKRSNQVLISMPLPIYLSTLALPTGFVFMIIRLVQTAIKVKKANYF